MLPREGARLAALFLIFNLVANTSQARYKSFVDSVTEEDFIRNTANLTCHDCSYPKGNYSCESGILNVECGVPPYKYCNEETYEELILSHYSRSFEFLDGSVDKYPGVQINVQLNNKDWGSLDDSFTVRIKELDSPLRSRCFDVTIGGFLSSRGIIKYDCIFPLEWDRRYRVSLLRPGDCTLLSQAFWIPPAPDPVTTPRDKWSSTSYFTRPEPFPEERGSHRVLAVLIPILASSLLMSLLVCWIKRAHMVNCAKKALNNCKKSTETTQHETPSATCLPRCVKDETPSRNGLPPIQGLSPHSTTPHMTPDWLRQDHPASPVSHPQKPRGHPITPDVDGTRTVRVHAVHAVCTHLPVRQSDWEDMLQDGDDINIHHMSDPRRQDRPPVRAYRQDSGFDSFEDDMYFEEDEYVPRTEITPNLKQSLLDRLADGPWGESRTSSMNTLDRALAEDNEEFEAMIA